MKLDDLKHLPILKGNCLIDEKGRQRRFVEVVDFEWQYRRQADNHFQSFAGVLGPIEPRKSASKNGNIGTKRILWHTENLWEYSLVYCRGAIIENGQKIPEHGGFHEVPISWIVEYKPMEYKNL